MTLPFSFVGKIAALQQNAHVQNILFSRPLMILISNARKSLTRMSANRIQE